MTEPTAPMWRPDPGWGPPLPGSARTPAQPVRRPDPITRLGRRAPTAVLVLGVLVLTLSIMLGCIAALNGFGLRNSLVEAQRNEVLHLGPVDVSLIRAYQYIDEDVVEVHASCQLTLASSASGLKYNISDGAIGYYRPPDQDLVFAESNTLTFGETPASFSTDRAVLAPGVPAIPCVFYFQLPAGSPSAEVFRVIIYELAFLEDQNVKNDADTSKSWLPTVDGYWVELPVEHPQRVY